MKSRLYNRRYTLNFAQWDSLSDSGKQYARTCHRLPFESLSPSARAVHAMLLEHAKLDRHARVPKSVKSGRVKIAAQIRKHRNWQALP